MAYYRKKPVVVEAFLLTRTFDINVTPVWFSEAVVAGVAVEQSSGDFWIDTLEGLMLARVGDYIIKGVSGELYPCKPDIFKATYEVADAVKQL